MKRCGEMTLGLRGSAMLLILLLTMMGQTPARAVPPAPAPNTTWFIDEPADDDELLPPLDEDEGDDEDLSEPPRDSNVFRRFWPKWRPTDEHERNHRAVREAFRDVVKDANQSTVQVYSGSRRVALGTVIDSNGLILTKASELRDTVECRLSDGRKFAAERLAVDDELDVAVLHIDATNLTPIQWRENEPPPAGSWLATVGSGELPTAVGVVSAAPRAIPMPQPVLGVILEDSDIGPRIGSIMPESPAEEAGLKEQDVVLEVNGKEVQKRDRLIEMIRAMRPGDRVDLLVQRGEEKLSISATLTEINSLAQGRRVDFQNSLGGRLSIRRWGFPSVLQHDTVLRPSDCGGPIVDLSGRAVGVNIARAGRVASYALPVSALDSILAQARDGGYLPLKADENPSTLSLDELRSAVERWSDRYKELEQQLAARRELLNDETPELEIAPSDDELARLTSDAANAKAELEKARGELERLERNESTEVKAGTN